MTCLCPSCSKNPGKTHTEEHRRACEARWVLRHRKEWRTAYYTEVEKFRGMEASRILIADTALAYKQMAKAA